MVEKTQQMTRPGGVMESSERTRGESVGWWNAAARKTARFGAEARRAGQSKRGDGKMPTAKLRLLRRRLKA